LIVYWLCYLYVITCATAGTVVMMHLWFISPILSILAFFAGVAAITQVLRVWEWLER
jgi:hypothetical protein